MAEKEPQEATQVNADGEAADTIPAAEQLPERIRVHALAKLLGTTSKRILAHLTEMGAQARSPQSSLDRTVAETVRDAFGPRSVEPATVDEAIIAGDELAADELAAEEVEAAEAAVTAPARKRAPKLFTSPFQQPELPVEEPVLYQPSAPVAAPLFLSPDVAAAEETRRKLRSERKPKVEEKPREEPVREDKPRAEKAKVEEQVRVESKAAESKAAESKAAESKAAESKAAEETADDSEDEQDWDGDDSREQRGDGASRRRRRGRRGRGRGRGEQHPDDENGEIDPEIEDQLRADAEAEAEESEDDADDSAVPEGSSSRRRRRRRRRKGGEDTDNEPEVAEDDPPNTVVHEREPRSKRRAAAKESNPDEVQGISGSTRLEAKRQRRRDGREAGRRRPPILTESEFLARRESVDRVMVVRDKHFADHPTSTTQVAVLEDGVLVEHFVTSTGSASMVGNVYLGKVQNVLPSMEAAFVDIGRGRNGVLYAGEVNWEAAGLGGKERKIEQALRPGDTVLVQVSKDPVGHKGARLTTQISLAGRFLVYVPGGTSTGISRKLPDTERKRLKEILRDIVPQDAGVIIRTASEGVSEPELARDVERLQQTWRTIEEQSKNGSNAPKTLYEEPDLLVKVVRDLFNEDFSKLIIEGERAWSTVENYVRTVAPDLLVRVEKYENNGVDVFGSLRIDEQLAKALDRKVWLPSGGTLVIDRTEAMTVIDVNTGKFTGAGGSNLEETVTRNNLEAAEEIVRQMRLRDIGGMIVVDFIDMVLESNRDLVLRRLTEALGRDRTRHQVSEVTSLGLVQMTRKKLGTGLVEAFSSTCEHCHGRGLIVHNYPVESAPAEEGVGRREGSRRRRKDRGNAAPEAAPAVVEPVAPVVEVETKEQAAARRAHPVALAMAAHHDDDLHHDDADPDEHGEVADEVAYAQQALADAAVAGAEAVAEAAKSEPVKASTNGTGRHTSESVSVAEAAAADAVVEEEAVAAAAEAAVVVERAQAAEPVVTEQVARPARRAGRRRVARAVTAPASASEGAVFVLSSADQPQSPSLSLADLAPAEVTPRARPRRRAAGRPAGAPEGEN
ncbi:translation initiation factor IF-2 N-terminal domain-containing protein [Nocardia acidivorans]|uniref:translation initiation factor IF-2 N-terminal domain-containing protein n=1 Tax=Nocardia acidivorans TaxID=404580 RepID=UPI0008324155|nr:translation initiation factor IF-2 N-terminal domain-containing protein [Nocardia acidivorans]